MESVAEEGGDGTAVESSRRGLRDMQKLEGMLAARLKALERELAESRAVIEGMKSSEVILILYCDCVITVYLLCSLAP